jgi:hypothetical protein
MPEDEKPSQPGSSEMDRLKAEAKDERCAAVENARRLACSMGEVMSLMHAFAAPRWLAQLDLSESPPQQFLAVFDDFLSILDRAISAGPNTQAKESRILEITRTVRAMLETWEVGHQAPEPIVKAAREWLRLLGMSVTDEEWDQWEGPKDESPTEGK